MLPEPSCVFPEARAPRTVAKPVQRVLLVAQDRLQVHALSSMCARAIPGADIQVARTAGAGLGCLSDQSADLVMTGLDFSDMDGLEVLPHFRARCGCLIIVSSRTDDYTISILRTACFNGFFDPREDDPAHLERELPRIAAGVACYLSSSVSRQLLEKRFRGPLAETLSPTELRVLRRIADGSTNREAARGLDMSERTLETHYQRIKKKLGVFSRTGLLWEALRLGVVRMHSIGARRDGE